MSIDLPKGYRPSPDEPFMNDLQREYFRRKLTVWRDELLEDYEETLTKLSSSDGRPGDMFDVASDETDRAIELRTRDRERKLISKIEQALDRIKQGTYGYCTETGQPIGLARLEARPTAELCIAAQEAHEKRERMQSRYDSD